MLKLILNGTPLELPDGSTVKDAVRAAGAPEGGRGVAAAVDGEVIPRAEWAARRLDPDDRVEVLQAVQGG
jgi:sulfur carrier protein